MSVYFAGIGGIGISAIARMMLGEGKIVTGSDRSPSPITDELTKLGAIIFFDHRAEHIRPNTELVVYSIALADDNPELIEARHRGIPMKSYPEMLGEISRAKFTIAVSGTHGKTTTTAMLAKIFIKAGLDPTVIVGSILFDAGSNFILGKSRYFIVEACEYKRSFLNLAPQILIVTNIDNDHLDYYCDLADIQSAFAELAAKLPSTGALICKAADPFSAPLIKATKARVIDYELFGSPIPKLTVPGKHNIKNAEAARAVSSVLEINPALALEALEQFSGTWRRFEYKGKAKNNALIYDDYAHHPSEIQATLSAGRQLFPDKKIYAVFQPYLYSRTRLLFNDFAVSFKEADEVVVAPIYAAREPADPAVSSEQLTRAIAGQGVSARYFTDFFAIARFLLKATGPNDLILFLGAGDIYRLADLLV